MKILESLKRTMESIEAKKACKNEDFDKFAAIKEKYADIDPEKLDAIIADVKEVCAPEKETSTTEVNDELMNSEESVENTTDTIPAKIEPDGDDVHKTDTLDSMNELDASEDGIAGETPEDFYTEDEDEEIDDELIISEEDDNEPEDTEDDMMTEEDEEDDFDVYQDELDKVDETGEDAEAIDMTIPVADDSVEDTDKAQKTENAEKIDLDVPTDDNGVDAADKGAKEIKNEDNSGAKAAMANKYNKGNFSSDVDALTAYLDEI